MTGEQTPAVTSHDLHGWADVEAEHLDQLDEDEFERFCADLIAFEAYERHDGPVLNGPAGRKVPDGGRDVLLTIKKTPLVSKVAYQQKYHLQPLTEDAQGRVAYSCKSGGNWLDLALRDLDPKHRQGVGRAVEVLLEGGYLKLLISTVGRLDGQVTRNKIKKTPHEHLVAALWERMKEVEPNAADPSARVEILDADTIVRFLRSRRPEGGSMARWAERLRLVPLLYSLDQWREQHAGDRAEPPFVNDAQREALRDELKAFLQSDAQTSRDCAAWIVGPPGVGKTRLVLETLASEPSIAQRVRVAITSQEAHDAINKDRLLQRHPAVVLVVDDCPSNEVDALATLFRVARGSQSSAHILLMTPASEDVLKSAKVSPRWYLRPLEQVAAEKLAAGTLGGPAESDKVREIAQLSQGYPWFATLLAREALAAGRLPHDLREAMKWVLAANREATLGRELDALRLRRARCLLATSLTRRVDWASLSEERLDGIAHAVGLERGRELFDVAHECSARGILRRSQGWHVKYVTPLVLEREVIAWLLDPGGGHDPGGRSLAHHGRDYLEDFFETLAALGLPRELLAGIAQVGLDDLLDVRADWSSLRAAGLLGPRLWFVARHAPGPTARELRRRIEASSIDELRARTDVRRGIMFALEELATRADAFEDSEAALLRLAQAENETYANNATATWTGLFLVELNTTHRSLAQRMALLERRVRDLDPEVRSIAIKGIQAALTTLTFRRAHEAVDGAWPRPTPEQARDARIHAWMLLAERFADSDQTVATEAKRAAVHELRGAIRAGIGREAIKEIAAHLSEFTEVERVKLREVLAEARAYEAAWLAEGGDYPKRLEELLAPTSFRERLRQHVGSWGTAALRKHAGALDEALAREGLAGDAPIQRELDWLTSDEASRFQAFAEVLGRWDERGLLLPGLRARARTWRTAWKARIVFARYLGGFANAGRSPEADAVLRDLRLDAEEASVLALATIELGATDERLARIEQALRGGLLDAACVLELGRRSHWLRGVSEGAFYAFLDALVEGDAIEHAAAALELLVDRTEGHPEGAAHLRDSMLRVLERLALNHVNGTTDFFWEQGARWLVKQGDAARVAELAMTALSRSQGSNHHAWAALHAAAEHDPSAAFRAVAGALADPRPAAGRLLMAFMFHRAPFAWPAADVLEWVGHDERRGRAATLLIRPRSKELDPIARALIKRFGPRSSVANELLGRLHSTDGLVPSLAEHFAKQLERARSWLADADPDVRAFAKRAVESLEVSHEQHAAYEEDERRRFGT